MAQAETKSITRRAFVRAASAVTAAVGTGAAVAVAAPVDPKERVAAAVEELRAALGVQFPGHKIEPYENLLPVGTTDASGFMMLFVRPIGF